MGKLAAILPIVALFAASATSCKPTTAPSTDPPTARLASALSPEVRLAMDTMIQDEYRSESLYLRVLRDFGEVRPFSNIVHAERRHSAAIALLYERRGLPVPASQWSPEDMPGYETLADACAAGVESELENIALYDRFLAQPLPDDVRETFEYNRRASLERHLRAFRRCVERG